MTVERQVVAALGSIGTATLGSRVLGFVRDMIVALTFGAGPVTDAFFVAFRIPNMLRRLLAEGALSTAIVPVFSEYCATRTPAEFSRMLRAVIAGALLALGATTLLGIAAAPGILRVIAPGFASDPGQMALAVFLTRVMFPYLLLVGLAALAMGALNAHGRFFAAALGPAVLNLGMIGAVLTLATRIEPPILALALGLLAGGVGQFLVQVPSLRRCGLLVSPSAELNHPALGRVVRLLLPAVFGLAAVQVTVFVNTLLASLLPAGSISFLNYADRVMEFPLGVFGIALASASLPAMARQAAAGDTRGVAATLNFTLRLGFYIAVPATVGLVILRTPIIRVLFERGQFGPTDTLATAQALAWYAVGLVGFSGARIAAQAFYAVGEAGTAVRLGLLSVAANVLAALVLMGPLAHGGLALASSIGAYVNVVLLLWVARRRFGGLGGRALLESLARTLLASTPLAAWCALWLWVWPRGGSGWLDAAWLALGVGMGAVIFLGTSRVLATPEYRALRGTLPFRGPR
ncbi:MAG TPA: murein biosynthesis integral membrane protein MurJ [Methylomirabilota bacterium]|jgi:putative peptidoglycan lipid II flippase|nr:murein biosynthesis integral membrane protein MurJ [Methylomirabilota bacterium]